MSIRCISLYRFPTNLCCIFLIYRFNCIIKHGNKRDVSVTCINSLWYWEESLSYFWREKKKKYLINVLYFIREMKKVLVRFASPWRGLNEKRAVVVLIFNGLLFPWEDGLWLFFLFGNIHSHHAHHPETWRNRLKRGRKTRDTTLPLQIPSKMGKRSFSVVFDRFSLHTCISSSQWQTQTLKGVIKVRKSSLLVARLGNYIHDKLEKMEGFFFHLWNLFWLSVGLRLLSQCFLLFFNYTPCNRRSSACDRGGFTRGFYVSRYTSQTDSAALLGQLSVT